SWKRFTGGRPVWSRTKAGSVAAGALAVASGASVPPQAETAAAMARDSSNRRGAVARMWISGVDGYGDGGSAGTGLGRTVRRRPVSRGCRRSCAGPVGPCDAAPVQAESVVWHGIGGAGMRVHFHGAAGEVTGSMHLVEAAGRRILLDCGMIQGGREAEARNFAPFPFDPASIDALVLSHAHIDHIGRIPRLVWQGFRGPVFIQHGGADLLPVMLLDAASLAENDAERENRKRRPGEPEAMPLFTRGDVADVLGLVRPLAYGARTQILPGVEIAFRDAGHILGSS